MAKVRFSLNQAVSAAKGFAKIGPDVIGEKHQPYQFFEWELEAVVDQDFVKELEGAFGAEADAPVLDGMVDVGASTGLGSDTELEQETTVTLRLRGHAKNYLEPRRPE